MLLKMILTAITNNCGDLAYPCLRPRRSKAGTKEKRTADAENYANQNTKINKHNL